MVDVSALSAEEKANLELAHEYMRIAYTPGLGSGENVAHLFAADNSFVGPTTFPGTDTLEQYADAHGELMTKLDDLHFVSFDIEMVQGDRVAFRYTATGTHKGAPHGDIQPTGRQATWTASALFRCENGKLVEFVKEWNKLPMWEQLGWPVEECLTYTNA